MSFPIEPHQDWNAAFTPPHMDYHDWPVQHGYLAHNATSELGADISREGPAVADAIREAYAAKPLVLGFTPGHGSQESIGPNREGDFFMLNPNDAPEDMAVGPWASHMGPLKFIGHEAMAKVGAARMGAAMQKASLERAAMDAYTALQQINRARDCVIGTAGSLGHKYEACRALGKDGWNDRTCNKMRIDREDAWGNVVNDQDSIAKETNLKTNVLTQIQINYIIFIFYEPIE